jgi:AcrR family transcriptional regulator
LVKLFVREDGAMATPSALDLLWGTPQRPRRGPKPSLSRERIVTEAIALADTDGLASLSMQHLAERLGCAKMALYRYVPGKAELVALMIDAAIGDPPPTIFGRYRAHPWSIEATTGARPNGPHEMAWLEGALAALAGTGLTGAERLDAVVLLNGHVRSLVQVAPPGQEGLEEEMARQALAALSAHADRYPQVMAAFSDGPGPTGRDNALDFGIDRILDGLAALIAERAAGTQSTRGR